MELNVLQNFSFMADRYLLQAEWIMIDRHQGKKKNNINVYACMLRPHDKIIYKWKYWEDPTKF